MPHNKQRARFCAVQYVQILLLGKICFGSYLHSVNCTCSNTMSSIDPTLKLGLLKAANFVLGILDFVAELLMGRTFSFGKREDRLLSLEKYDKSAQLVRVVARQGRAEFLHFEHLDQVGWEYHSHLLLIHCQQFILAHEEYVHPRFVLSPGVGRVASLYFFEDNHAVFGVCDTGRKWQLIKINTQLMY